MRQVQIYLRRVFLPTPSEQANIHSILAYDVLRTENVGLPTKSRFNGGPASFNTGHSSTTLAQH